jgi:hypothetical protein
MRETVDAMANAEGLESLRDAFAESVSQLESAVDWLVGNAMEDPNVPGAASVNLLLLAGTVLGGWQMARSALACVGDTAGDRAFADAKLATAQFYGRYVLPRSAAFAAGATAGPDQVMAIPEEQF